MDCFKEQDLNPRTCRFSKKCKEGYERNEVFRCRKIIKPRLKKTLKKSKSLPKQPSPPATIATYKFIFIILKFKYIKKIKIAT